MRDNVPIVVAGQDLHEGEEVLLGVEGYIVGQDVRAGTILYWLDGRLRPWKLDEAGTPPSSATSRTRRSRGSTARSTPGTRMSGTGPVTPTSGGEPPDPLA